MEELERIKKMQEIENEKRKQGYKLICGVDEAGRGPLCGPVVAGAVILKEDEVIIGINDSKKISEKKREKLFDEINEKAIAVSVGIVWQDEIDEINILNATKKAMKMAVENLKIKPDYCLIDGNQKVNLDINYETVIKGDMLSESIAAASIIAKVTRDRMLIEDDKKYPEYGFAKHKGYGTKAHIEAIKKYGLCDLHRKTFCKKFVSDDNE